MKAVQLQPQVEQTLQLKQDRTQTGLLLGQVSEERNQTTMRRWMEGERQTWTAGHSPLVVVRFPRRVLAQSWDHRVNVLAAVATPPLTKSASGGGGGWNRTEWFLEHARQVRRMLVGGVELLGMYVVDANAERLRSFENDAALRDMIYGLPLSPCSTDRILLRAGAGGKVSGESYSGGKKDGLKPKPITSIKTANIAASLVVLETTLQLDVTVPVQPASAGTPLKMQLRRGLEPFQASVLAAQAIINGASVDSALVLDKAFETDGGSSGASKGRGKGGKGGKKAASASSKDASDSDDSTAQSVELFLRPSVVPPADAAAVGLVRLQGAVHSRVYAHNKSSVGQALASLKQDVLNSMQSRLQLLCEDSEDALGAFDLPSDGQASFTWQLPRRLFVPVAGAACVCDYLLPHESAEDGVQRIAELLGVAASADAAAAPFTRERCAEVDENARENVAASAPATATSTTAASSSKSAAASSSDSAAAKPTAVATSNNSALMLQVAFGVLALALSAAFLTQLM